MSRIFVHVIKAKEKKFYIHAISLNKERWYLLPKDSRDVKLHPVLLSKKAIKNAFLAIKSPKGYRKRGIKLEEDVKEVYFDESDNICFKSLPLEEQSVECQINVQPTSLSILEERIKFLQSQFKSNKYEVKLHQIEKKLIIEKFNKKQQLDATRWVERF